MEKRIMRTLMIGLVAILAIACAPKSNFEALDLMSSGLPIKINAPADAVVKVKDIGGIFKDVTVKQGDSYYLQITSSTALTQNVELRVAEEKRTVLAMSSFSKIMEEDASGFIFEKKIGEKLSYDFRRVRIQGDDEYLFQTGLVGSFDLESVKAMFLAVK